jgi:hypothetical protein
MVLHVPPTVTDPADALRRIREQCPQTGNKKLQDIYVAVILDNPRLHSAVLAQSFVRVIGTSYQRRAGPVNSTKRFLDFTLTGVNPESGLKQRLLVGAASIGVRSVDDLAHDLAPDHQRRRRGLEGNPNGHTIKLALIGHTIKLALMTKQCYNCGGQIVYGEPHKFIINRATTWWCAECFELWAQMTWPEETFGPRSPKMHQTQSQRRS